MFPENALLFSKLNRPPAGFLTREKKVRITVGIVMAVGFKRFRP